MRCTQLSQPGPITKDGDKTLAVWEQVYKHLHVSCFDNQQSGKKTKLVAKILATNFGFVPD